MRHLIGLDLGGTKVEIVLCRDTPLNLLEKKRVQTDQSGGYDTLIRQLGELLLEFIQKCETPPLIGMGIPGTLIRETGMVRNSNIQCILGRPLKQDLEERIGHKIHIENDANCFALSEAVFGSGKGHRLVMGIIMGTGMGGGLVIDGKIWEGAQGIAAEWGHSTIDYQGPLCWCGRKGCLEQYLSGTGVERSYFAASGQKKKLPEIFALAEEKKDPHASSAISELIRYFGIGIANLIVTVDPNIIVIGGGVSNIPLLYTHGVEETKKHVFNHELKTPIVQHSLGDSSGVFGAVQVALTFG